MQVNYIVLEPSSDCTFVFPGGADFQLFAIKADQYFVVVTKDFGSKSPVILKDILFIRTESTIEEAVQGTLDSLNLIIRVLNDSIDKPELLSSPVFEYNEYYIQRSRVNLHLNNYTSEKSKQSKEFSYFPIFHKSMLSQDDIEVVERAMKYDDAKYLEYVNVFQNAMNIIGVVLPAITPDDGDLLLNYKPGVKSDVYIERSSE